MASAPALAQEPPTNPPSRCPPMSPNRCRLIQRDVEPSCGEASTTDGDHSIKEESVEVDNRVGTDPGVAGLQAREVTADSCPTRRASKVIENCCDL